MNVLIAKVTGFKRGNDFYKKYDRYIKKVNLMDPNDLALFLQDLQLLFNAPVEEAILLVRKRKDDIFWQ